MFNIVLLEPEIPQNTGNISRTCAATGAGLHIIEPMGFELSDRYLKRAGLDYWHLLELHIYKDLQDFYGKNPLARPWMLSTKGGKSYSGAAFDKGDYLMFGRETKGLPESMLEENPGRVLRIPMIDEARSLNLSNSVAVVLYEAFRQHGFEGLHQKGAVPREKL